MMDPMVAELEKRLEEARRTLDECQAERTKLREQYRDAAVGVERFWRGRFEALQNRIRLAAAVVSAAEATVRAEADPSFTEAPGEFWEAFDGLKGALAALKDSLAPETSSADAAHRETAGEGPHGPGSTTPLSPSGAGEPDE